MCTVWSVLNLNFKNILRVDLTTIYENICGQHSVHAHAVPLKLQLFLYLLIIIVTNQVVKSLTYKQMAF